MEADQSDESVIDISSSSQQSNESLSSLLVVYFTSRSSDCNSGTKDESESDVFNTSLANLPFSQQQRTLSTEEESSINPTIASPQKTPVQSQSDSKSLVSPVLAKRGNQSLKRDSSEPTNSPPPMSSSEQSFLSPDSAFRRSLLCVTPIKDRKVKSVKAAKQQSDTPPNFWSLDMPPTP